MWELLFSFPLKSQEVLQSPTSDTRVYFHKKNNPFSPSRCHIKLRYRDRSPRFLWMLGAHTFVKEPEQSNSGPGPAVGMDAAGRSRLSISVTWLNSVLRHCSGSGRDGGNLWKSKEGTVTRNVQSLRCGWSSVWHSAFVPLSPHSSWASAEMLRASLPLPARPSSDAIRSPTPNPPKRR